MQESQGGRFEVSLDSENIFSKIEKGRFPDAGEVESLITKKI